VFDALLKDVRYAVRWLVRSPGFTLVALASLAISIGFNTALFSTVDAILFRPLPVAAPDRLVDVFTNDTDGDPYATSSRPDFLDLRAGNAVFEDVFAYSPMIAALNLPDRSRLALGEVVSGTYFRTLGVGASLGRTLTPADDEPGAERVVVVSHRYWMREMGRDRAAVGRTLRLRGQPYTIVGVLPSGFTGMTPVIAPEIWLPLVHVGEVEPAGIQHTVPSSTGTSRLDRRGQRWLFMKGRLRAGVTVEQAEANLDVLMRQLAGAYPATNRDYHTTIKPTSEVRIHPAARGVLLPASAGLMVVVGLVLLIACANVASMLLARASARQREMSIRLAIGASRGRLVRQLLTESLVLAGLGAVAGTWLAWWLTRLVSTLDLPIPIPVSLDLRIDGRVLAFTLVATVVAGVLAGLAPAIGASRPLLAGDLRGESRATRVAGRRWTLRDLLVAGQIAVTLVLLVAAGLLTRSLLAAERTDVGFRTNGLAILSMDPTMLRYDATRAAQFFDTALARARAIPGVEGAALAARLPFSINFNTQNIYVPGFHAPGDRMPSLQTTQVSPEYFDTLGIPILEGRTFASSDTPDSPGVVVVNETMARRFWPRESAIGRRLQLRGPEGPSFEIVGVVADYKVQTVGEQPTPYIHFAQRQRRDPFQMVLVRTRGDAGALLSDLRRQLLALEPNLVFLDSQTMEAQVGTTLLPVRIGAMVVGVIGLIGMLLAAIGLYGVIGYSVTRRTREIGIRLALGARPSTMLAMVLRHGLLVTAAGLVVGSLLAAAAARALGALLYGVGVGDPVAWVSAIALVLAAALIANLVPARRAARVEPSRALRSE
jgi:predicted permease